MRNAKYRNEPTIIPASDDQGHNAQIMVRVPPEWLRQMDVISKESKFPYANRGDIVRDAIYRHFIWLEEYHEVPGSTLHKIQAMLDVIEEARSQQGFEKVLAKLEERVQYFSTKGARGEAVKCVLRILGYVGDMPEGHWRDQFKKEIRERYAGLLNCSPKAKLNGGTIGE